MKKLEIIIKPVSDRTSTGEYSDGKIFVTEV